MTTMVGMSNTQRTYLPAAGRDLFLPLYDLIAKLLGADGARRTLFDLAPLRPGDRVLDIGCGTGTFATMLKQRYPSVEVTGLDPDARALARARRKAEQARVLVRLDQGFADSLEYPAASFDVVFSSFMFHHLEGSNREKTLREVHRVLKPGGSFYLLDFEVSPSGHGCSSCFTRASVCEITLRAAFSASWGMLDFQTAKRSQPVPLSLVLGTPDTIKRLRHDEPLGKYEEHGKLKRSEQNFMYDSG
jgi:ubiquinone/menaquinone biosynthesis C-methylase UbiE